MPVRWTTRSLVAGLALAAPLAAHGAVDEAEAFRAAARVLEARCTSCHAGPRAEMSMRLTADALYRDTVNVTARSDRRRRRVDPGNPDASLLYLKLLAPSEGHYSGPRMPMTGAPLAEDELQTIRTWIESFPQDRWGPPPPPPKDTETVRAFPDSHLAQLPTAEPITPGMLQFRILHRFSQNAPDAGVDDLFGLDGGAEISFGLAYGINEHLEAGLRRTSFGKGFEGYAKAGFLHEGRGAPLSAALQLSAAHLDDEQRANRDRWAAQLLVSKRFGERFSAFLAPSWASDTNWLDPSDDRGTAAIGVGVAYKLNSFLSVTGEWVHPVSGVKAPYDAVSVGFAVGTGKHVFHLLVTNTEGLHTDLYLPGGDLDFADGDFRLGFNISRLFDLRRSPP